MSAAEESRRRPDYAKMGLILVRFECWNITGRTFIQSNGVYEDHEHVQRHRNLGAVDCGGDLMADQALSRIVWDLGKQITYGWRELSSPKD